MKFNVQNDPPGMALTACNQEEANTLCQKFGLAKDGDTITLTRRDKPKPEPEKDDPGMFEVSFVTTPPILKKKKIAREDR